MSQVTYKRFGISRQWMAFLATVLAAGSMVQAEVGRMRWGGEISGAMEGCTHCREVLLERIARLERGDSAAFDATTGRSLLNYPPHRPMDTERISLELTIADMNVPVLEGKATLTLQATASSVTSIELDAVQMKVHAVRVSTDDGFVDADFSHDAKKLKIRFPKAVSRGKETKLEVSYTVSNPTDGLTWTPEDPAWPGRPAQLHSQGQTESNRFWIPCLDSPSERVISDLAITVPSGYVVSSNGKLVSQIPTSLGSRDGYERWAFAQNEPHVSYLISLIVGKFDIVQLPAAGSSRVPMRVFAPLGRGSDVERSYGRTGKMLDVFSKLFDEPYPWDKYDQLLVHNFGAGGMENTSVTTMFVHAIVNENAYKDQDYDGLIAHELVHQWFGDYITCKSWEHIWLNEGFATYFDALWYEYKPQDASRGWLTAGSRAWYEWEIWTGVQNVLANDKPESPNVPGMASNVWRRSGETFSRAANPYPKGAYVLHMLRKDLGDELFFKVIAAYIDEHKQRAVETGDFRRVLERVSGENFERFFKQWVVRPGVPKVSVAWSALPDGSVSLDLKQSQPINADNPAFDIDFDVWVLQAGSSDQPAGQSGVSRWNKARVRFDTREHRTTIVTSGQVVAIAADPQMATLVDWDVEQSAKAWAALAGDKELSVVGRARAIDALAKLATASLDAEGKSEEFQLRMLPLVSLARNPDVFFGLRQWALAALGREGLILLQAVEDSQSINELVTDPDARIRKSLLDALRAAMNLDEQKIKARVMPELRDRLKALGNTMSDQAQSYAVRAAAIRLIGALGRPMQVDGATVQDLTQLPIVIAAAEVESHNDQIRQAAVDALDAMKAPAGFEVVIGATRRGIYDRTRAGAIDAMVSMAKHLNQTDRASAVLEGLKDDVEERVRNRAKSTAETLGKLREAK